MAHRDKIESHASNETGEKRERERPKKNWQDAMHDILQIEQKETLAGIASFTFLGNSCLIFANWYLAHCI